MADESLAPASPPPGSGIRRAGLSLQWKVAGSVAERLLNILSMAIMARLLSKSDFGLVFLANVAYSLVGMMRDMGVTEAIIRSNDTSQRLLSTCFWVRFTIGLGLYLVLVIVAAPFAQFFSRAELYPILLVMGVAYFLDAFPSVLEAMLIRDLRMGPVTLARIGSSLVGLIVGVLAAWQGLGAWALIASALATTLSSALYLFPFNRWLPSLWIARDHVGYLLHFGGHLTMTQVLGWFTENFSTAVLGKFVDDSLVAIFRLAYTIGKWPDSLLGSILGGGLSVSFFARIQHDPKRMRDGLRQASAVMYLTGLSMTAVIILLRQPLVLAIWSEKWADVADYLPIITIGGMALMLRQTLRHWLIASGHSDALFRNQILAAAVAVPAVLVGVRYGVMGVITASSIACIVECVMLWVGNSRRTGLGAVEWLCEFWRPIVVAAIVSLSLIGLNRLVPDDTPAGIHLTVGLCVATLVWGMSAWIITPREINFVFQLLGRRKPQFRPPQNREASQPQGND